MKFLAHLLLLLFCSPAIAEVGTTFNFIWVTAGPNGWQTVSALAQVTWKGNEFKAEVVSEGATEFRLTGKVTNDKVKAIFNALETDFWVDAPFAGSYHMEHHKDIDPCGSEVFALTDGYNFIGLRRKFRDEKCKL